MRVAMVRPLVVALGLALVAGCASSKQETQSPAGQSTQAMKQGMPPMCPMVVPGTKVEAAPVDDGAAMMFTTSDAGQVEELRKRVRAMAERHNAHHGQGGPMGCPASQATAEDVEGGARLTLKPAQPADLEAVRKHVADRVAAMQAGRCPMMGHGAECQCPHAKGECQCPHGKDGKCECPKDCQCPHCKGMQEGGGCPHCKHGAQQGAGGAACGCAADGKGGCPKDCNCPHCKAMREQHGQPGAAGEQPGESCH